MKGDILKAALKMNDIARNIRKKRFENGSMSFERSKARFKLDENHYPIEIEPEVRKESCFMVEEYMLLANKFVGQFIVNTCEEIGVLRCHPPPNKNKIGILEGILNRLNLKMEFDSSKAIQESSNKIFQDEKVPKVHKVILKSKMCKILEAARYFVVEFTPKEDWAHFALSFDVYTHFTSPIRYILNYFLNS